MIAFWGPKTFEVNSNVVYTFDKITRSTSFSVEDKENGKKKPKLKNKHPDLEEMSFSIYLNARLLRYNVREEIESWASLCGKAYYFIVGNKAYGNHKWKLVSSSATEQKVNVYGDFISAKIDLNFKECPGSAKKSAKSTRNTKSNAAIKSRTKK